MTVFVDEVTSYPTEAIQPRARQHGNRWSHLWCDGDEDELHALAERIGLRRSWFQTHGTLRHYDCVPSKRSAAIRCGAVVMSLRQFLRERRAALGGSVTVATAIERPLNLDAWQVRALLQGRLTHVSLPVSPLPTAEPGPVGELALSSGSGFGFTAAGRTYLSPVGRPGERLWLREPWYPAYARSEHNSGVIFAADYGLRPDLAADYQPTDGWKPPGRMSKWASRLRAIVTSVTAVSLEEFTDQMAVLCGICQHPGGWGTGPHGALDGSPLVAFRRWWCDVHGPGYWSAGVATWVIGLRQETA
jgi:Rieske Fe-S protein